VPSQERVKLAAASGRDSGFAARFYGKALKVWKKPTGCHPERSEESLHFPAVLTTYEQLQRSFASLRMTDFEFLHTFSLSAQQAAEPLD
jgi:hypothetical protein